MRAIQADAFDHSLNSLRVVEVDRPRPEQGEVLVEVDCAPFNPADRMMIGGTYIRGTVPPFVPGLVGVGVVRAAGGGLLPRLLVGKRVVFASTKGKSGAWAEFTVAPADLCVPLAKDVSDEAGVNLLANATTAVALVSTLNAGAHKGVVVTAAGGEVARMLAIEARRKGIAVVGIVRSEENATRLREEGGFNAVVAAHGNSAADDLKQAIALHHVTAAIDAVAGDMVHLLMEALPDGGVVHALGRMSGQNASFDVMRQLIGRGMRIEGFSIDRWFAGRSLPARLRAVSQAQRLLKESGGTVPARVLSLEEAVGGLAETVAGKTLIAPKGLRRAGL